MNVQEFYNSYYKRANKVTINSRKIEQNNIFVKDLAGKASDGTPLTPLSFLNNGKASPFIFFAVHRTLVL